MKMLLVILPLVGLALGAVASYWFQPGILQAFMSLGKYLSELPELVSGITRKGSDQEISMTFYISSILGLIVGLVVAIVLMKMRAKPVESD